MNNDNQKQNRSGYILILLLLIGSVAFNVYQYKNHTTTVIQAASDIDSLINVRVAVERELVSTEMELEKYQGIAGNLDTLLREAKVEVAKQEQKIRELLRNEKNSDKLNKQLKRELATLSQLRDDYLEKIDSLMAENETLKLQNAQLNTTITNLNETKTGLEKQVATASQLKAEYVKVISYKKKSNGKFVESALAKKTNKIEACVTVMDNKVAIAGERIVYLRILSPEGKPLMGLNKGQFTLNGADEIIDATSNVKINYTGGKQDICICYENDERILGNGTYTVEIYLDNTLVHASNYVLR